MYSKTITVLYTKKITDEDHRLIAYLKYIIEFCGKPVKQYEILV